MRQGWLKLHRELQEKAIWKCSTPEQKVVLMTILMLANHQENEWEFAGEKFMCRSGQLVTSLNSLADACGKGISVQNVRTALIRFEKLGFLTNVSTKTGRLITVENWGKYQCFEEVPNKATDKDVTENEQSPNKEPTPIKNDKNETKKEKKIFIPPSVEEVREYCRQRQNKVDAELFVAYYESNGWMVGKNKMKSWKASVITWEKNSKKDKGVVKDERTISEQRKFYDPFGL